MDHRLLPHLLLLGALFLSGCAQPDDDATPGDGGDGTDNDGTDTNGDGDTVSISGFAFHPQGLEVPPATTVIWTNEDDVDHTATADDGSWDAGTLEPGRSDGHTFSDEGEYPYHCAIHPSMTGTITVVR